MRKQLKHFRNEGEDLIAEEFYVQSILPPGPFTIFVDCMYDRKTDFYYVIMEKMNIVED